MLKQTSIQTKKHRLKIIKQGQNRSILCGRNKETKTKKLELKFLGTIMRAHT